MPIKNAVTTRAPVARAMERGRTLLATGGRLARGLCEAGATEGATAGGKAEDGGAFENAGASGAAGMGSRERVAGRKGAGATEDPPSRD